MQQLVTIVSHAVALKAQSFLLDQNAADVSYIVVHLPVTMFMIKSSSDVALASQVARKLPFAPAMHRLADKVLVSIAERAQTFNAAHLRFDSDAWEWTILMEGTDNFKIENLKAMQKAGFNNSNPVYLAKGLLTDVQGHDVLADMTKSMEYAGLCSCVWSKEDFLDDNELSGLHSEQKALVDLLVFAKANAFVGFKSSTFSFFANQYRILLGLSPESSVLLEGEDSATNLLFDTAAVIASGMP